MTIKRTLFAGALAKATLVAAVGLIGAVSYMHIAADLRHTLRSELPEIHSSGQLVTEMSGLALNLDDYLSAVAEGRSSAAAGYQTQIVVHLDRFPALLAAFEAGADRQLSAATDAVDQTDARADRQRAAALTDQFGHLRQDLRALFSWNQAHGRLALDPALRYRCPQEIGALTAACLQLQQGASADVSRLITDTVAQAAPSIWFIEVAVFAALCISLVIGYIVVVPLTTRLLQLRHAARELSQGNLHTRCEPGTPDEIGLVALAMNDLAAGLERAHAQALQSDAVLRHSEEKFRSLFDNSPDALMTSEPPFGTFTSGNAAALKMFGARDEAEFIATSAVELSPQQQPDGRPSADKAREMIELALRNGHHFFEWTHRRLDGTDFPATVLLSRLPSAGPTLLQATVRDITDQKRAQDELEQYRKHLEELVMERTTELAQLNAALETRVAERTRELTTSNATIQKFSCAIEQTSAFVLSTDLHGNIEWVNSAMTASTGYTADELLGKNPKLLKSGLVPEATYRQMWTTLSAGHTWRGELQNRRKNGELYWVWSVITPVKDAHGAVTNYVAVQDDITDRKRMEDELRTAARTDRLTGLPNRAVFCDRLEQAIHRTHRLHDRGFALMFLDVDHFNLINNNLGHNTGDALLTQIAARLRESVRPMDSVSRTAAENTAARLGGDEFVVLLEGIRDPADLLAITQRVLANLTRPYHLADREIIITISLGIVTSDMGEQSAEDILRDADTAMYKAKTQGGNRYKIFDAAMRAVMLERLAIASDLRRALTGRELFLTYQPVVALDTCRVAGFEALVRWRHPQRGLISPAQFIPVAEECGLIVPIGEWVLREACRHYALWRARLGDEAPPTLNVNLSRAQLMLPELPGLLAKILAETGVEPRRLHLEITETAVMSDARQAVKVLGDLKQLGVKLDLDDFGTGYSSLASLHMFPLDVLKIDCSIIANASRGPQFTALIQAVTQLAKNMGMSVIAEGVETKEQIQMLRSLHCQFVQGFLYSKPLEFEDAMKFRVDECHLPAPIARAG